MKQKIQLLLEGENLTLTIFAKKIPSSMFHWVLNTSLTIFLPKLLHAVLIALFFVVLTGG